MTTGTGHLQARHARPPALTPALDLAPPYAAMSRHRVRVWFGDHTVVDHCCDSDSAGPFAAAMKRRFPSLRVTDHIIREPTASMTAKTSAETTFETTGAFA